MPSESSGASSSFRSLINELYTLESVLLRVKRFDLHISHVEKVALQQVASQCQRTLGTFYKKIQKYQSHLQCMPKSRIHNIKALPQGYRISRAKLWACLVQLPAASHRAFSKGESCSNQAPE